MATKLTKRVRREVILRGLSGREEIFIVSLYENAMIGIRRKGKRKEFGTTLAAVLSLAAKQEAEAIRLARIKAKREKKK